MFVFKAKDRVYVDDDRFRFNRFAGENAGTTSFDLEHKVRALANDSALIPDLFADVKYGLVNTHMTGALFGYRAETITKRENLSWLDERLEWSSWHVIAQAVTRKTIEPTFIEIPSGHGGTFFLYTANTNHAQRVLVYWLDDGTVLADSSQSNLDRRLLFHGGRVVAYNETTLESSLIDSDALARFVFTNAVVPDVKYGIAYGDTAVYATSRNACVKTLMHDAEDIDKYDVARIEHTFDLVKTNQGFTSMAVTQTTVPSHVFTWR